MSVGFLLKQMWMIQDETGIRELCQEGKRGMKPSVKDLSGFVDCLSLDYIYLKTAIYTFFFSFPAKRR